MFAHLYAHTDYSLLESCLTVASYIGSGKQLQFSALALTDHNTTAGLSQFVKGCLEAGIKPICGLELDMNPVVASAGLARKGFPLVFLAEDKVGYGNLLKLASLKKPVSFADASQFLDGLLVLSGGVQGELYHLASEEQERAVLKYNDFMTNFCSKDRWFVQLVVGNDMAKHAANSIVRLLPEGQFVATQEVRLLSAEQQEALRALEALRTGRPLQSIQIALQPMGRGEEVSAQFAKLPQAIANVGKITQRCATYTIEGCPFPKVPDLGELSQKAFQLAEQRYGSLDQRVRDRLEHELAVIKEMGYDDYFLIVADIVAFAKANGIAVGPGRGSAASSVVAYSLGITDVDPLKYGLIFERFLNKARQTMPDIDIDFCYERREEVLVYIKERFGSAHVAQIGTYGTFGIRAAIRDLGKVYEVSEAEVRRFLQGLPSQGQSIGWESVQGRFKQYPQFFRAVQHIHGLKRHFSTHAAGIILTAPYPVTDFSAVEERRGTLNVTQFAMGCLEDMGILKIDLLGLRTLTVLQCAVQKIREKEQDFSLSALNQDDKATYELLCSGHSIAIFQLESTMFQELLQEFKPSCFKELIALLALGRPGPLKNVPEYVRRKSTEGKTVQYQTKDMEEILKETYGLMVYQEQVMEIAHKVAGFSMEDADMLRIAMSKKKHNLLQGFQGKFIAGAIKSGLGEGEAFSLFQDMESFADYAFNKAHSASYAHITFWCAYLKAHYPTEFYLAVLQNVSIPDKIGELLQEAISRGLTVLPPEIHSSQAEFSAEGAAIRYGLRPLKFLGPQGVEQIIAERRKEPFINLNDFRRRVQLPSQALVALCESGALDCFGNRQTTWQSLTNSPETPGDGELLAKEKEIVGIYLTDHPLSRWEKFLERLKRGYPGLIAGHIKTVRIRGAVLEGELWENTTVHSFQLPRRNSNGERDLRPGVLVALFGEEGLPFKATTYLPLRPLLILNPKNTAQLGKLQQTLPTYHGDYPVLLRLGSDTLQLLPQPYWCHCSKALFESLKEQEVHYQWFDPWQERQ